MLCDALVEKRLCESQNRYESWSRGTSENATNVRLEERVWLPESVERRLSSPNANYLLMDFSSQLCEICLFRHRLLSTIFFHFNSMCNSFSAQFFQSLFVLAFLFYSRFALVSNHFGNELGVANAGIITSCLRWLFVDCFSLVSFLILFLLRILPSTTSIVSLVDDSSLSPHNRRWIIFAVWV